MSHDPNPGDRRRRRPRSRALSRALALVAVVLAAVALPVMPSGAAEPEPQPVPDAPQAEPNVPLAPAATVTPSTGLVQGDTVTVAGTGFPANTNIGVIQCIPGDGVEFCGMSTLTYAFTNSSGAFSISFAPKRILRVAGVDHDCSVAGACRIGMGTVPDGSGGTATVDIQFDPSVPPPPPPTVTVTPSTGLLDRQSVTVAGSGFDPNDFLNVVQCQDPPSPTISNCVYGSPGYTVTDGNGSFSVSIDVRRVVYANGTAVDCADAGACVISVGSMSSYGESVTAAIQFDGSVPLPPPPTVTVTPSTDLLDGDSVTVTGSGFSPGDQVAVLQCQAEETGDGTGCNTAAYKMVQADGAGAISTPFVVDRMLYIGSGMVDCAVVGCRMVAATLPMGYPNASADIAFDGSVPPPPPPTLVAEPGTGLVDGQTITLHGSGYPRNRSLGMAQCLTDVPTSVGCDLTAYKFVTTDANGAFTTTFRVKSSYQSAGRGFVDCTIPQNCRIGAGTGENGLGADAVLTFSTAGPTTTTTTTPGASVLAEQQTAVTPNFTG